jgi:sarcosine oxidase
MPDSRHQSFDVIVLGVGSVGSATCHHLAERGARVLGIDQFTIPHNRGSHHGNSRMIRRAYYEHPDYVPLLKRAYKLWDKLQKNTSRKFFHITGGLYVGSQSGSIFPGSLRAAHQHRLDHSILSAQQISERYPALRIPGDFSGFYEDQAGFLVPGEAISSYTQSALRHGAVISQGEKILSWDTRSDHVEVTTEKGSYRGDHLVITAGAWSGQAAQNLGLALQVTRQVLAWFEPLGSPERFAPGNFPCWFIETEPPFGHYGFPLLDGDPGLKIALHKPGETITPECLQKESNQPRPEEIAHLRGVLDKYFPGCAGRLSHACTCMYTNSLDGHFIVGSHPGRDRVSMACGLSGHGFKFSSVLGEILADLALNGRTSLPIGFLNPQRHWPGE